MQAEKKLVNEVNTVEMLYDITMVYEEIYANRMRAIRESVLRNRYFLENLHTVFAQVKSSYRRVFEKTKIKNGKSVAILVSANKKFSGDVNQREFFSFYNYIKERECDVIIIGRIGKNYYDQKGKFRPYIYFDKPEGAYKAEDLKPIIELIVNYESVEVFYGRFINLIEQGVDQTSVTGDISKYEREHTSQDSYRAHFLFEPKVEQILRFFESQIFASFFKQATQESYLADIGARIAKMESSINNIEAKLEILRPELKRRVRQEKNKRQIKSFAGISFWGKGL